MSRRYPKQMPMVALLIILSMLLAACGTESQANPTAIQQAPEPTLVPALTGDVVEPGVKGSLGFATIPPDCDRRLTYNEALQDEVIRLTNEERRKNGNLPAVTKNDKLTVAAQMHTKDMTCRDILSHDGSNGSQVPDRIRAAGYSCCRMYAENVAAGQKTAQDVVQAWMNSAGHRKNILNQYVTEIGVSYVLDPNHPYRWPYWTQKFAAPRGGTITQPTATTGPAAPTATRPAGAAATATTRPAAATATTGSSGGAATATTRPAGAATATPATAGCTATNNPALETEVVRLINAERSKRGLAALGTPGALTTASRSYASDMVCKQPTDFPDDRLAALGYSAASSSSSTAQNSNNQAAQQANAWITSGGATQSVLSSNFTSIGVGYAQKPGTNTNYWVLILTKP